MKSNDIGAVGAALLAFVVGWYFGSTSAKTNEKAVYGRDLGLPVNCRAYVQASIDGLRRGEYSFDDGLAGLERNCGAYGHLWGISEEP